MSATGALNAALDSFASAGVKIFSYIVWPLASSNSAGPITAMGFTELVLFRVLKRLNREPGFVWVPLWVDVLVATVLVCGLTPGGVLGLKGVPLNLFLKNDPRPVAGGVPL